MSRQRETTETPAVSLGSLIAILDRYRDEEGALIPVLQETQEAYGYLPRPAIYAIGKALRLSPAQVYAVATFYAQFHTRPRGQHVLRLCTGTACHVRGAEGIKTGLEAELGVAAGETTPDQMFTLETVACLGACALAPTMVVDGETHGEMTIAKVQRLLRRLGRE